MNYDTIIIEMLSRIQVLEEKVKKLEETKETMVFEEDAKDSSKISTSDIRNYITDLKKSAERNGEKFIVLTSREIHGALHLKQRYPMVCNAMRQTMRQGDKIVYSPESGYSSTLEIKYYL